MNVILSVSELRELAGELLDLATQGTEGRRESDKLYRAITEQRDFGKGYSSCGDLAHWLLYRLGVRSGYINRAEFEGWRQGLNVARLAFNCPDARPPRVGERFEQGDILIVWNKTDGTDAHVLVVREQTTDSLLSADGGQPGLKRRVRPLDTERMLLGSGQQAKKIQRVLKFKDVIEGASARGELMPAQRPAEWLSRVVAEPDTGRRPTLRLGDVGEHVEALQRMLGIRVTGTFDRLTHKAVVDFQKSRGLVPDGNPGPKTWRELGAQ